MASFTRAILKKNVVGVAARQVAKIVSLIC
jgi:hypothetical protein